MASMLVDEAASQATSRSDFVHQLAEWIPTPQRRREFLRAFGLGG
jgi:hypothetical protein